MVEKCAIRKYGKGGEHRRDSLIWHEENNPSPGFAVPSPLRRRPPFDRLRALSEAEAFSTAPRCESK